MAQGSSAVLGAGTWRWRARPAGLSEGGGGCSHLDAGTRAWGGNKCFFPHGNGRLLTPLGGVLRLILDGRGSSLTWGSLARLGSTS